MSWGETFETGTCTSHLAHVAKVMAMRRDGVTGTAPLSLSTTRTVRHLRGVRRLDATCREWELVETRRDCA